MKHNDAWLAGIAECIAYLSYRTGPKRRLVFSDKDAALLDAVAAEIGEPGSRQPGRLEYYRGDLIHGILSRIEPHLRGERLRGQMAQFETAT